MVLGKKKFLFGAKGSVFKQAFEGVIPSLQNELNEGELDPEIAQELSCWSECKSCKGTRLKPEVLNVLVDGNSIWDLNKLSIEDALKKINGLSLNNSQSLIALPIVKEIRSRLEFLDNVGLRYLTISRTAASLSGGESQRIRLATQIGSKLVGVLYILDEPSIGLHQRDNDRLIKTLEQLRDLGNSVIVVEHDEETIRRSDHVVDLGPGAGEHGGEVVFSGTPKEIRKSKNSLTGKYLTGKLKIPVPTRRPIEDSLSRITLVGCRLNNLKNIDFDIPLGRFIVITGVSGSGKSSLVIDTLLPVIAAKKTGPHIPEHLVSEVKGLDNIDKVVHVDQSPIGRTPRSNPATYTGLFSDIRTLFSGLPESRVRGYTPGRFSFNVSGGRCDGCSGDGNIRMTMHFLPDVFVECEVCRGSRYNKGTLEVKYRSKSIAEVLDMTIEDAHQFFKRVPKLKLKLKTLLDVGMGYVHLGQSAVTLSGGGGTKNQIIERVESTRHRKNVVCP